jgi:hypothetical protein
MGPGEVKVDLADFDLKKQDNLSAKTSFKSFCTSYMAF